MDSTMASLKLRELYKLHYEQGYKITSMEVLVHKDGRSHAKVELVNDSESLVLESEDDDFAQALLRFKETIGQDGQRRMRKLRDTGAYYDAVLDLVDADESKIRGALQDQSNGKSPLPQGFRSRLGTAPLKLLFGTTPANDPDLQWLRENHFRFVAYYIAELTSLRNYQSQVLSPKHPDIPEIYNMTQSLLKDAFLPRSTNASLLVAYKKYREFLPDTLEYQTTRMSIQTTYMHDIARMLDAAGVREKRVRILYILDLYRRCYELVRPMLDLLRVAIEWRETKKKPAVDVADEGILGILRSNGCEVLTRSMEPAIRNCESHLATQIDVSNQTVLFTRRAKLSRIVELALTFDQVVAMNDYLRVVLVQALYSAFSDFDDMFRLLLLSSFDYKLLLVTRTAI